MEGPLASPDLNTRLIIRMKSGFMAFLSETALLLTLHFHKLQVQVFEITEPQCSQLKQQSFNAMRLNDTVVIRPCQ